MAHSAGAHRRPQAGGTSAPTGPAKHAKQIAAALIIGAAAVTLGISAHHELQTTASVLTKRAVRVATHSDNQVECIYQTIRRDVPQGAAVYLENPNVFYFQRLEELSTLWAVPQPTLATAQYKVFLYKTTGHCGGVALAVRRA